MGDIDSVVARSADGCDADGTTGTSSKRRFAEQGEGASDHCRVRYEEVETLARCHNHWGAVRGGRNSVGRCPSAVILGVAEAEWKRRKIARVAGGRRAGKLDPIRGPSLGDLPEQVPRFSQLVGRREQSAVSERGQDGGDGVRSPADIVCEGADAS